MENDEKFLDKINYEANAQFKKRINLKEIDSFEKMIDEIIKEVLINRNRRKEIKTLPIICFIYFFDENRRVNVLSANINYKWLGKEDDSNKFKTHAEYLCLEEISDMKNINKSTDLFSIISIPPCKECHTKLKDYSFKEINYLLDKKNKLKDGNYLDIWSKENGVTFKKISIENDLEKKEKLDKAIISIRSSI